MKATMNAAGVITLRPETSIEAFALRQWMSQAEETFYAEDPGRLTKKPVMAWPQDSLVVNDEEPPHA